MEMYLWMMIVYAVGTIIGYQFGVKRGVMTGIESAIDNLCQDGYLHWRKNRKGEVEIRKINEEYSKD